MPGPLRLAFLGCGFITRVHSRHLRTLRRDIVPYYASRDATRAEEYCRRFGGGGTYSEYAAAIDDPRIDAVVVAVPPRFHLDLTLQALRAGKHVLVEKPAYPAAEDYFTAMQARDRGTPYAVCHAHFFMSGLVARRLKQALGIPYVVTFHALGRVRLLHQPHDEFPPQRCILEQMVIDGADAVVAECPQDEMDLQHHYRTPASRMRMIPCGFDPDELQPVTRAEARVHLGLPAERPIVLQLGRMVPRKGVDTVIHALGVLERRYRLNPLLLIVGGESTTPDPVRTPEIGRLQRIAQDEGVAADVQFVGQRPRSELRYFYSASDVFVTMPWYEPFGITPVEAMACGVPVIGARVGGVQYSVEDGRTGFLVEARNADALARRLAHVFSDPSIPRLLGKRARRRAWERFTWEQVSRSLADLYAEVATAASLSRPALAQGTR